MIDEDEIEVAEGPSKWSWLNLVSIFCAFLFGLCTVAAHSWKLTYEAIDSHVEWKAQRKVFAERAALELEALTREPSPVGARV